RSGIGIPAGLDTHETPGLDDVVGAHPPELSCGEMRVGEHVHRLGDHACIDAPAAAFAEDIPPRAAPEKALDTLLPGFARRSVQGGTVVCQPIDTADRIVEPCLVDPVG